jgi:hypothetical protein
MALAVCQVATADPTLTAASAERIADAKARSFRNGLRRYEHWPAHYDADDESWWVAYRQRGSTVAEFNVRVEAKTRKAWIVLP